MAVGPMTAVLATAADRLAREGGAAASAGSAIAAQLSEPLRVAVVGRVSAGKSTLVNALLAQNVAATGAGETTRVPCWFRYGTWTTSVLRQANGQVKPVRLVDGHLPDVLSSGGLALGVQLEVTMPVPILRTATIVDTPGIAGVNDEVAGQTAALLTAATDDAAHRVEALVVVLTGPLRADEAAAMAALAKAVPAAGTVPAVAALTRVDTLHPDPTTAFKLAGELAASIADAHPDLFTAVVPIAGLLASTAMSGALTETDARCLAEIATAWDASTRAIALADARLFAVEEGPVTLPQRRRLVDLLGCAGISLCLTRLSDRPGADATALTDHLRTLSGIDDLLNALRAALADRSDLLKASVAAHALRMILAGPGQPSRLVDDIADLLDSPVLQPIQLAEALSGLASSRTPLSAELAAQVRDARRGRLPLMPGVRTSAYVASWRGWALIADGPGRRAAEAMCRAWEASTEGVR
jgi:hypothetical protein